MVRRAGFKLHKKWEFQRVYQSGRKFGLDHITLFVFNRTDSNATRLGITVTKKIAGAVGRNRLRRQLNEIFFTIRCNIRPGFDIVFMPRKNIFEISYSIMLDEIKKGLTEIGIFEENTCGYGNNAG